MPLLSELPEIDIALHGRPLTPGEAIAVLKQHYNDLPPAIVPHERRNKVLLLKAVKTFECLVTGLEGDL